MNIFKYEAFLDEFPFLDKIMVHHNYEPEDLTSKGIVVKRADERMLTSIPLNIGYDCCRGKRWNRNDIHFVTNTGVILDAVKQEVDWKYADNYISPYLCEGESVIEAISRHRVEKNLHTIVWTSSSGCHFDDTPTERIIEIYKMPKDITYSDFIEKARQQEEGNLRAEIAVTLG